MFDCPYLKYLMKSSSNFNLVENMVKFNFERNWFTNSKNMGYLESKKELKKDIHIINCQ